MQLAVIVMPFATIHDVMRLWTWRRAQSPTNPLIREPARRQLSVGSSWVATAVRQMTAAGHSCRVSAVFDPQRFP